MGKGTVSKTDDTDVIIPNNIFKNPTSLLKGKGPWHNGKYVDLVISFKLQFQKGYTITNQKLMYTMNINLAESLCGFKKFIPHPSGKDILIISEPGYVINSENIYVLDQLGFSSDIMFLAYSIHYPENIELPKKKVLSFDNLAIACGGRGSEDVDIDFPIEDTYKLKTLRKLSDLGHNASDDDMEGQQAQCTQQ